MIMRIGGEQLQVNNLDNYTGHDHEDKLGIVTGEQFR